MYRYFIHRILTLAKGGFGVSLWEPFWEPFNLNLNTYYIKYTRTKPVQVVMANTTQTMNTTEVEYISIYEKPKLPKGRPKGTRKFTDGEKLGRRREANMR